MLEQDGDVRVVGEAEEGDEGVRLVAELQPDVVLLDLTMPVLDGLEAIPLIRESAPRTAIVVLSGLGADTMAREALDAGAHGYVEKGAELVEIANAVRRAARVLEPDGGAAVGEREPDDRARFGVVDPQGPAVPPRRG